MLKALAMGKDIELAVETLGTSPPSTFFISPGSFHSGLPSWSNNS